MKIFNVEGFSQIRLVLKTILSMKIGGSNLSENWLPKNQPGYHLAPILILKAIT
jgi:hypothetical protein